MIVDEQEGNLNLPKDPYRDVDVDSQTGHGDRTSPAPQNTPVHDTAQQVHHL